LQGGGREALFRVKITTTGRKEKELKQSGKIGAGRRCTPVTGERQKTLEVSFTPLLCYIWSLSFGNNL
jgi:hypothetical protein